MHIALEGINGTGKTTQLNRIVEWAEEAGLRVKQSRLPGSKHLDTTMEIRKMLDVHGKTLTKAAKFFLYMADFAEHTARVVGQHDYDLLILDRSPVSTLVYQGIMGGVPMPLIEEGFQLVGNAMPDYLILLDSDAKVARSRIQATAGEQNKTVGGFDSMSDAWYETLRNGYLDVVKTHFTDANHIIIDVEHNDAATSFEQIKKALASRLNIVG